MKKQSKRNLKTKQSELVWSDEFWLKRVQILIDKHSTAPAKTGKYKGHATTDTNEWIAELSEEIEVWIKKYHGKKPYDENMAAASLLGRILAIWYCNVRRAKSFDPNRPLDRKSANVLVNKYIGEVVQQMVSDELMGKVFGPDQYWNFPWGKGAFGGDFI